MGCAINSFAKPTQKDTIYVAAIGLNMHRTARVLYSLSAFILVNATSHAAYADKYLSETQFDYSLNCADAMGRYISAATVGQAEFDHDLTESVGNVAKLGSKLEKFKPTREQQDALHAHLSGKPEKWRKAEQGIAEMSSRQEYSNRIATLLEEATTCMDGFPMEGR